MRPDFHIMREPTFKGTLSKSVKKPELSLITRMRVNDFGLRRRKNLFLSLEIESIHTKFNKNRTRNGSATVDTNLKVS